LGILSEVAAGAGAGPLLRARIAHKSEPHFVFARDSGVGGHMSSSEIDARVSLTNDAEVRA
jgi:hypothetical protein